YSPDSEPLLASQYSLSTVSPILLPKVSPTRVAVSFQVSPPVVQSSRGLTGCRARHRFHLVSTVGYALRPGELEVRRWNGWMKESTGRSWKGCMESSKAGGWGRRCCCSV